MKAKETAPPIVSLVLIAYNQERFVREATRSALAQTYSPLEITLSDDCSADGTFGIIQETAAAYRGPHAVRAVRNDANMGVLRHYLLRGREAKGAFIHLAAGDDISMPRRVERQMAAYDCGEALAVTTASQRIDATGG